MNFIDPELQRYIEGNILPEYDHFDKAHHRDHALSVIRRSLDLAEHYDVNPDMVYAAAAYHDTGLAEGRERHHLVSGQIIRADRMLERWFDAAQIETIAQAAEDHRASASHSPRTIYGLILAEADRDIVPRTVIRRTVQYSMDHFPDYDKERHWERTKAHLIEKYGDEGYLQLWIPESPNAVRLEELRGIIRDEDGLRSVFEEIWKEENPSNL